MSFKNLEQRYKDNVGKLYAGAKTKFENGHASRGANDDPLIVRKPGDGYWIFSEGRSLPIKSSLLDVKRLTLFTFSKRGVLFLAKQQLLQTGNTFEHTRIINPAFAIANAVPFLHVKRQLRPVTLGGPVGKLLGKVGIGKDNTDINTIEGLRKIGQLQQETYDRFVGADATVGGKIKSLLKKIPVVGQTISAATAKRSVGENLDWKNSRPELTKKDGTYFIEALLSDIPEPPSPDTKDNPTKKGASKLGRFLKSVVNKIAKAVLGKNIFNTSKAGAFKYGGEVTTKYFVGQRYGLVTRNGKKPGGQHTTYLKFSDGKKSWDKFEQFVANNSAWGELADKPAISDVAFKNALDQRYRAGTQFGQIDDTAKQFKDRTNQFIEAITKNSLQPDESQPFLRYFKAGGDEAIVNRFQTSDGNDKVVGESLGQLNARDLADNKDKKKKISYIRDPANEPQEQPNNKLLPAYRDLPTVSFASSGSSPSFDDPIIVSFAMANDPHVQFRAFIRNLQQTAAPQYKDYQYIGRIDKFISFVTVQRQISFKLDIVAFSQEELATVWKRINYLTGLVFPYGINKGILQPNVTRLTIGQVYVNQPGYITSLNTNFNEMAESWDLDYEVPIGATMDIQYSLIEKRTALASTPLYGITENVDGFAKQLRVPPPPGKK